MSKVCGRLRRTGARTAKRSLELRGVKHLPGLSGGGEVA